MRRWQLAGTPPPHARVLGLERHLILPTLGVLLVVLLWAVFVPAIDRAVNDQEIAAGTVYDVGPALFSPAPGWVLVEPPSPVGDGRAATVFKGGVTFHVKGGHWHGGANELLAQAAREQREFLVEGQTYPVRSAQGASGVARRIHGPDFTGVLIAFVDPSGVGVAITAKGPLDASEQLVRPIAQMIQGVAFKPTAGQ